MSIDAFDQFDLDQARRQEAQRRLEILGDLIFAPKDRRLLQSRSRDTGVPPMTLQLCQFAHATAPLICSNAAPLLLSDAPSKNRRLCSNTAPPICSNAAPLLTA